MIHEELLLPVKISMEASDWKVRETTRPATLPARTRRLARPERRAMRGRERKDGKDVRRFISKWKQRVNGERNDVPFTPAMSPGLNRAHANRQRNCVQQRGVD